MSALVPTTRTSVMTWTSERRHARDSVDLIRSALPHGRYSPPSQCIRCLRISQSPPGETTSSLRGNESPRRATWGIL